MVINLECIKMLNKKDILKIERFFRGKPVKKAFLFGSYTRNEANENSDVDILIELDYSETIGLGFVGMQLGLQEILNKKVDLLSDKAVSKYIRPYIDKEKVLIYER